MKTAILFPGQGSQWSGMGRDLVERFPEAAHVFARIDAALGLSVSAMCLREPQATLDRTENAQVAVFATSLAAWHVLRPRLPHGWRPIAMAGHSLGEYTALVAAGAFELDAAASLVRARGELMRAAGEATPGGLTALLGIQYDTVVRLCREESHDGVLSLANDNSPGQLVVGGTLDALRRLEQRVRNERLGRAVRLRVNVASHTPLMQTAAAALGELLPKVPISVPSVPVIGNTAAQALESADAVRSELQSQVVRPVQWRNTILELLARGVEAVLQVGPGTTLIDMLQRWLPNLRRLSFGDQVAMLDDVVAALQDGAT